MTVGIQRRGASLVLLIIAVVLEIVSSLGVGDKLGFGLEPLGIAALAAAFIF